jgi:hypothetical protein
MRLYRLEELDSETLKKLSWNATPEQVAEALRLSKEQFSAADLQKFTEIEELIPFEDVLTALECQQRAFR